MAIELLALFIPIIGLVLGVLIAIVWIVTSHRLKIQRNDMRHKERLAAIEKGLELPLDVEPAENDKENDRKHSSLRSGLMGLFVGIVLYFAVRAVVDNDVALFGLIPAAVGIANLVSYFFEVKKKNGKGRDLKRDA